MRVKIQPMRSKNGLAVHVFRKFFERMIAIAITLDGQTAAVALHDQSIRKAPTRHCGAT